MSDAVTRGIRVTVRSAYIPERSDPERPLFFFAYRIRIANEGTTTARLLTRHWIITDGQGGIEEVKGPGVVGEQPLLAPGENFEYTSACPLPTPVGTMHGTYQMLTALEKRFDAEIAPFLLVPGTVH
ncbi:MAG: Co2+/Mg2+ efflux protein ApaG [bacterium]